MSLLRKALVKAKAERSSLLLDAYTDTERTAEERAGKEGLKTPFGEASAVRDKDLPDDGNMSECADRESKVGWRGAFFDYTRTRVIEVPEAVFLKNRLVTVRDDDPANEHFKLIRTQLFQRTRSKRLNTIMVAGFSVGDGASFLALNLAISIAKDTRHTSLLADFNFRAPAIGRLLGLEDNPGLKSYLFDDVALEEIIISPGIKKLTLLLAGGTITNPTELLGSPRMEDLVRELKHRHEDRYIIIDTPPITCCPDPMVVSEYVDGIILVVRAHQTSHHSVKSAIDHFPKDKILGVVLNDMPPGELDS
jgi:capsular exopolysaccharide synthesis family protein